MLSSSPHIKRPIQAETLGKKCCEDDLMCLQTISLVNGLIEERAVLSRLILPLLVRHGKLHDQTDFKAILNVKLLNVRSKQKTKLLTLMSLNLRLSTQ